MNILKQPQLAQMTAYLRSKNEIALHLVLCSATRGLLSAVCRRITLLDSFSTRAITWYENREKANQNAGGASDPRAAAHAALYAAYQKIRRHTSSSLIKADEFDKLLTSLSADIRSAYNTSLAPLGEKAAKAASNSQAAQGQNSNAPRPDVAQEAISRGRQHCEMNLLLLQAPPPSFVSVVDKFFNKDLKEFRAHSDVAKLYFGDYSILEVQDGPRTLAKRKAAGLKVDLFKKVEVSRQMRHDAKGRILWRGCARCGSIMEDLVMGTNKPGLSFLLRQQGHCCCGGRMAVLPGIEQS